MSDEVSYDVPGIGIIIILLFIITINTCNTQNEIGSLRKEVQKCQSIQRRVR